MNVRKMSAMLSLGVFCIVLAGDPSFAGASNNKKVIEDIEKDQATDEKLGVIEEEGEVKEKKKPAIPGPEEMPLEARPGFRQDPTDSGIGQNP